MVRSNNSKRRNDERMEAILPRSPLVDKDNESFHNLPIRAEVVEWQTRTFEGRVGKPMRVQVPPSAPSILTTEYNSHTSKFCSASNGIKAGLEPGVLKGIFPLHGVTGA